MYSYVIKFVSVDGLVRYEERKSSRKPDDYIDRRAAVVPEVGGVLTDEIQTSVRVVRRSYKLASHWIHPETGQYIFEYKELA